jgi:hypothetical protein
MGIVSRLFDGIEGVYWFPVLALGIFILLFLLMTVHTMSLKKNKAEEFGALPFEHGEKFDSKEVDVKP